MTSPFGIWLLELLWSLDVGAWSFFREAPLQAESNIGGVPSLNPITLIRASYLCGLPLTQPTNPYDD
jgi:hypothetical protein